MNFDETTIIVFCLIALIISLVIMYYIIKQAARDALKETIKDIKSNDDILSAIDKQNRLLALLLSDGKEDKKYALTERATGKVITINSEELVDYELQDYDIDVVAKK